jgi:hypothetical protein
MKQGEKMLSCRWGFSMFLIIAFLAFSSSSWADKKWKHQMDQQAWDDQRDRRASDQPPGWDKGKKTGWHGDHLPPGQEKKNYRSYKHKPEFEDEHEWPRDDH